MSYPISNKYKTCIEPNTYKRGSQRTYYIVCTNRLTLFVRHCDILLSDLITTSNHRELFINIDLYLFLKDPLHQLITNIDRLLRINNPKCVHKYKINLMKHILQ